MKIILNTDSLFSAISLKDRIIRVLKGEINGINIDTWSYVKSRDNFDIVYHNPEQYTLCPEKNVLFRLQIDGTNVVLSPAWWSKNPEPAIEIQCLHVGRLTEMLLRYFNSNYIKFTIVS